MKFTKLPSDLESIIQINSGIICKTFSPENGTASDIIGATTGNISFSANPNFVDFGEDINNCPPNTKQMRRVSYYNPTLSATFVTIDSELASILCNAGVKGSDMKIPIGKSLVFNDIWFVGDYGNTGSSFIAIKLANALNNASFQWSSTKDGKGQFTAEFNAHYDLSSPDDHPFEVYISGFTSAE